MESPSFAPASRAKRIELLALLEPKNAARFWAKVKRTSPLGCWPWTGAISKNGYGSFGLNGQAITSSRGAYTLETGNDPGELSVLHHCDNRPCCNPAHLYAGTIRDNSRDMVARGRNRSGNTRGEANPRCRLTANKVQEVRRLLKSGMNNCQIGRRFNVHHATISAIRRGKSWSHLA